MVAIETNQSFNATQLFVLQTFATKKSNQEKEELQKEIQEYCYKILKEKDLLEEMHNGDYRNIHLLEDSKYL